MKVLITRTDKLGDLVLSLPVVDYLRAARPDLEIHVMVAPVSVPLVENHPLVASVWTWADTDSSTRLAGLKSELAAENFQAVIMLQYRRELALLLKSAGIGQRYGPLSRWSSWLLLNRGSWQKRGHSDGHEMDFNLDLAGRFLRPDARPECRPELATLHLSAGQRAKGKEFRQEFQLGADKAVFIHPGSGGSAQDWQPGRFAGVANSLASLEGFQVFITGAGPDARVVERMKPTLDSRVRLLVDRYNLRDFLGVLTGADYFVGPSTGPLHMASALGVGVVGLYPLKRTMRPMRWGPRGPSVRTVTPDQSRPADSANRKERSRQGNCMDDIYERDVLAAVLDLHRHATTAALKSETAPEE